jgi:hypothetical protein
LTSGFTLCVADGRGELVAQPELPLGFGARLGGHVRAAADDHAAEHIAPDVYRSRQPLREQLRDRGLARGLDTGDEHDRGVRQCWRHGEATYGCSGQ